MYSNNIIELKDIIWVKCEGNNQNHIQNGVRPGVVIQNNKGNYYSSTLQIIPLTSRISKGRLPTHTVIPANSLTGLSKISIAQCEGSRLISKEDILGKIGQVDDKIIKDIARCWLINNPLIIFFSKQELLNLQKDIIRQFA